MTQVSDRLQNLSESQTIAMAKRSREMQSQGIDVISLSLGEPDFNTPDFIKESAKKAIDENFSKYTPVAGYLELREAICTKLERDNALDYNPYQIVVSTGAKQSIANVVLSLVNPGDEVIIPKPYWVSYIEIVKMAEGIPVFIETSIEDDFKISAEQLKEVITPKSKLMIYSSPCNPSGSIYSKEELESLSEVIKTKSDLYVISDEIYEHINFSAKHESLAQFPDIYNQVITINGLSKGFAMTGWRLGYIAAPEWIADACDKIQGQFTSATCSITQRSAIDAMLCDPKEMEYMKDAFLERRDFVLNGLSQMKGFKLNKPEGAFYVFPDISALFGKEYQGETIKTATDLSMFLLNEAQVAVVTGEAFGSPNCIRLSYATSKDVLEEAINRISTAVSKLK